MLFDIVSAVELTASASVVVLLLSFTLSQTVIGRLRAATALGVWFVIVVAFGASLAFDDQVGVGTIGLGIAVVVPIAALCIAFFAVPTMRDAMLAVPLPALIAVNTVRVLGVSFVLLHAAHRLPAPFAPAAGWGDIFVGVTAAPVAWAAARYGERVRALVLLWNVIGFIDLVSAIGLGATSSPGPFRLFLDPPGSQLMAALPWILIPCFLVPALQALHIVIFYRLARSAGGASIVKPDMSVSALARP
jgi:hypothetical protein